MESGVLGLGPVTWTDGWNATASESGLRLPIDPARLLEVLRGVPVARALLTDLQRAVAAGRSVQLRVSADQQVAEISTGSGRYVLTQAARNAVLAALVNRSQAPAAVKEAPPSSQSHPAAGVDQEAVVTSRPAPAGILWEIPTAAREPTPLDVIALPWLGPAAYLEVQRDRTGTPSGQEAQSEVASARLHLQLPQLGRLDAHIRVCGNAVAVSIDGASATRLEGQLPALQQRLQAQGLVAAHVAAHVSPDASTHNAIATASV
jgi:hypothetical protein